MELDTNQNYLGSISRCKAAKDVQFNDTGPIHGLQNKIHDLSHVRNVFWVPDIMTCIHSLKKDTVKLLASQQLLSVLAIF